MGALSQLSHEIKGPCPRSGRGAFFSELALLPARRMLTVAARQKAA